MKRELTAKEEISLIRKKRGYMTFEKESEFWLDLGDPDLNASLGNRIKGTAFGKMVEIHGWESHGKTLLATKIAAIAQQAGAFVGWCPLEGWSPRWMKRHGLDTDKVVCFSPSVALSMKDFKAGKVDKKFIQSAEEIFEEMEDWMLLKYNQNPENRLCIVVDSVNAILTDEEKNTGLIDFNMRTNASQSTFMSRMCRRWANIVENYNALVIFINQLREKPGIIYGSPEYSPGGKALKFYCSVRVKVRRVKDGRIKKNGKIIGIKSLVINVKNKLGSEGQRAGFKAMMNGNWKFYPAEQLEREAKGE